MFLPFQTRPTWAYPVHYALALASSVIPKLRPITRLAVRFARLLAGQGLAAFPCSASFTGWFRFALYTGSADVRAEGPLSPRTRLRTFWFKPNQSLWLGYCYDACERSFSLTLSPDSSAPLD
jgi:hypothetical protein